MTALPSPGVFGAVVIASTSSSDASRFKHEVSLSTDAFISSSRCS